MRKTITIGKHRYYKKICPVCNKEFITTHKTQKCCSRTCAWQLRELIPYVRDYFSNIDCESKAYWLGFIWGDGHIENKPTNYRLNIKLSMKDSEHLLKFAKELNAETQIRYYAGEISINIFSKSIVKDLVNLGMKEHCVPKLKEELMQHFWRGLFDADGCISHLNKFHTPYINLACNTKEICEGFGKFLGINNNVYRQGKIWIFNKSISRCIDDIFNKLYSNATIYLERKYNRFVSFIKKNKWLKKVYQYDKSNNLIQIYPTMSEAERQTGIPEPNISKVCKGERKTAGGYIWKYY